MKFSITQEKLQPGPGVAVLKLKNDLPQAMQPFFQAAWNDKRDVFYSGFPESSSAQYPLGVWASAHTARAKLDKSAREAAAWAKKYPEKLFIDASELTPEEALARAPVLVSVLSDATYRYQAFADTTSDKQLQEVVFYAPAADAQDFQAALHTADVTARAMAFAKDLGNAPANVCTPEFLASAAQARAQSVGATAKIHSPKDIEALGMNTFLSVARGSYVEPRFIELSFQGASSDSAPIVLVGKGITFDAGGISLKPAEGMDEMKYDMCGAATVIATFCAAAELKLPINLKALVPACENMPSGRANRPGDVIKSLKGLSIEILNTDAEGRLVLCDVLTYAEQFKPQAVVDVATLTGACIIALGHHTTGLMGNDEKLIEELLLAGKSSHDVAWRLPLGEEYVEQLKSNFADLANIGGRPAGAITAAAFLSRFTEDYAWAHLDIAGTAWKSGKDKGATGRPIPLLLTWLQSRAQSLSGSLD